MRPRLSLGSRTVLALGAAAFIVLALVLAPSLSSPSQPDAAPAPRASADPRPIARDGHEPAVAAAPAIPTAAHPLAANGRHASATSQSRPRSALAAPEKRNRNERPRPHEIDWRHSRALELNYSGTLEHGVMLPSEGRAWVSWDPVERDKPDRWWRRWGTDDLVRRTLATVRGFAADHPHASRILIGDLSRPHGGDFGPQFGSIGHASHQNGLDVDVYYPRLDGREWPAALPEQVDDRLAQDLVDRFVDAGAEKVFVGPNLPLTGPAGIVVPLEHHDDHLHFRLPASAAP